MGWQTCLLVNTGSSAVCHRHVTLGTGLTDPQVLVGVSAGLLATSATSRPMLAREVSVRL